MNKRTIFIVIIVILFCVFFYLGFNIKNKKEQNNIIRNDMKFEQNDNELVNENTIETTSQEEKITPNTMLVLKKYYEDCGHTMCKKAIIPEEMVNLTERQIQEKYSNWVIEEFSKEQVVLYKKLSSFCGEHYLLIEEEGYISIYTIDEEGNRTIKESKRISVEYLSETDKIELKNGIMVYGAEELNKILEDFES